MQRRTWFELHDHPLSPRFLRDFVTDGLEAMWSANNPFSAIIPRLQQALDEAGTDRVIDLCSGGGGPWLSLSRGFERTGRAAPLVCLTDKYPNQEAIVRIRERRIKSVEFCADSVDAMHIPSRLTGFRTLFSGFHHFAPEQGRTILKDAFEQRQGIAVFEAVNCDLRSVLTISAVPFMALWLAPRIRPFRWSRMFWTYVLPLVPFTLWFDGVMSSLRAYSHADYAELTEGFVAEDYRWEIGETRGGLVRIQHLIGWPVQRGRQEFATSVAMKSPQSEVAMRA